MNVYAGSDTSGEPVQELGTVADAGEWSVTADELADGVYTVQASQSDGAGNTGLSAPVTFTVDTDTTAPTVRITAPADGSSTDDTTPTLRGSAGTAPNDSPDVQRDPPLGWVRRADLDGAPGQRRRLVRGRLGARAGRLHGDRHAGRRQ